MKNIFTFLILLLTIVISHNLNAATFIVSNVGDSGPGTLRQAVLDANAQLGTDTITFDPSTNGSPVFVTTGGDLIVEESLVVIGNGTDQTIIQDDQSAGGAATFYLNSGILKVQNVKFTNMYNGIRSSTPGTEIVVSNCSFIGGAGSNLAIDPSYAKLQLSDCYIEAMGNWGIADVYGDCIIENSTFNNCVSGAVGTNVTNSNVQLEIRNSTFTGNGQAIFISLTYDLAIGVITNNTIYNNNIGINIYEDLNNTMAGFGNSLQLNNNIISSNSTSFRLYNDNFLGAYGGNPVCTNNICDGGSQLSPYGPISWYSTSDPLLDPSGLIDNGGSTPTVAILAGSPAIDAANVAYAPSKDQRQYFRSGPPDIGAFEFNGSPCNLPTIPTVTSVDPTVCVTYSTTLNISGSLNDASYWAIYSGSCGGTLVGTTTGSTFNVTPTFPSTTYFVRGEGGCVSGGSCGQTSISVSNFEDAKYTYSKGFYCMSDIDPTPIITGTSGGTFSSTPAGLSIDPSTGTIDLSASIPNTYTIRYTTPGICSDFHDVQVIVDPCVPDTKVRADYCGITLASINDPIYCDAVAGATDYEWEITDPSSNIHTYIRQNGIKYVRLSYFGLGASNTTYSVKVRARVNGYWGNYNVVCTVTTPVSLPAVQIASPYCGITLSNINDFFYCNDVPGADFYEWEFTDPLSVVTTYVRTNGTPNMKLTYAGLNAPNTQYDVRVRASFGGQWGPYGNSCTITSPAVNLTTQVTANDCGRVLTSFTEIIYCDKVLGATYYQWRFEDASNNVTTYVRLNGTTNFKLAYMNLPALNTQYDVQVRAYVNGVWQSYGPICQITSPSSAAISIDDNDPEVLELFKIGLFAEESTSGIDTNSIFSETMVYPNPFNDFLNIEFGNYDVKNITIYNSLGQVIKTLTTSDAKLVLETNDFTNGIFIMHITSGNVLKAIRLFKT